MKFDEIMDEFNFRTYVNNGDFIYCNNSITIEKTKFDNKTVWNISINGINHALHAKKKVVTEILKSHLGIS